MDPFPLRFDIPGRPDAALRRLEPADWALEQILTRVPDIPRWTLYPRDLDEATARLRAARNVAAAEAGRGVRYVIEERGVPLGTIGFGRSDAGFELFYAMRPEGRGRGLVTDSVKTLAAWLEAQGERVIWLSTLNGNAASEAVAMRCGFRRERKGTHIDGRRLTVWRRTVATPG